MATDAAVTRNRVPTRTRIESPKSRPPTKYSASYVGRVFEYCLLGLTDAQIGNCLGAADRTIREWRGKYPEFASAFERGRQIADG